jgi:predicted RNA binding protein YcfA (HicA-like mRNA interferase family)
MHKEGSPSLVVVPLHTRDLPRGTLHGILEDAGLAVEEFVELL